MIGRVFSRRTRWFLVIVVMSFILVPLFVEPIMGPRLAHDYLSDLRRLVEQNDAVDIPLNLNQDVVLMSQEVFNDKGPEYLSDEVLIINERKHLYYTAPDLTSLIALQPYEILDNQLISIKTQLRLFLAFFYLVLMSVHWYNVKRMKKALVPFRQQALNYAMADFSERVVSQSSLTDELMLSFNRMARQLEQQFNQLLQRDDILNHVLNAMNDGVIAINVDHDMLLSNIHAENLLALLHKDSSRTTNIIPVEWEEDISMTMKNLENCLTYVKVQGRTFILLFSPLIRENHTFGVVIISRDVTEEENLNQLREMFVANVSHELRTPISLLQGYSEAIVDGVATSLEDQRALAQVILEESKRMGRLVNDLLDLAKLTSGHMVLQRECYPVRDFVHRLIAKFQHKASLNQVEVVADVHEDAQVLTFDYDRLEQVFTNLIDNALRYTKEGIITLRVYKEKKRCYFYVIDTGEGIKEADLPFLFERFYKADKSRTRNKSGTGLGLAIAKEIVEAHGGTISVTSHIGKGTTFTIVLPDVELYD